MATRAVTPWKYTAEQLDALPSGCSLIDSEGNAYMKKERAWWRSSEQLTARQLATLQFIAAIWPRE